MIGPGHIPWSERVNRRDRQAASWRDRFPDGCGLLAGSIAVGIGAVCLMQEMAKGIG